PLLFMVAPSIVGMMQRRLPTAHLSVEHGRYTADDTHGTDAAVLAYAVGLWAFAGVRIVVGAFYSLQDTRTPVLVAGAALAANIALSLALMRPFAHAGLALATALSAMLNMALLVVLLDRRLGSLGWPAILRSHGRVLLASLPIVSTCLWVAGLGVWTQPGVWATKAVILIVG